MLCQNEHHRDFTFAEHLQSDDHVLYRLVPNILPSFFLAQSFSVLNQEGRKFSMFLRSEDRYRSLLISLVVLIVFLIMQACGAGGSSGGGDASSDSTADSEIPFLTVCADGCDFSFIQAAIDDEKLENGYVIKVSAGTYPEDITVSKRISIIGAGSDIEKGTIITGASAGKAGVTNGVIQLVASGLSETEPVLFQDLRVEVDKMAGFSVGLHNLDTTEDVSFIKLDNVVVTGYNGDPTSENERGLYVAPTSSLRHLTVKNSSFDNMTYGWYFHKKVSEESSTVEHVTVRNTGFNHNFIKGIYAEKLSEAVFSNCSAVNNGFTNEDIPWYFLNWLTGIDINLKAGIYKNITFLNCKVENNGHGYDDSGNGSTIEGTGYAIEEASSSSEEAGFVGKAKEGAGYAIKARDDGSTYGAFPAYLEGVSIIGGSITDNERGIRLGEPDKGNGGPTKVTVSYVSFSGNVKTYDGSDGSEYGNLVNQSDTTADAAYNYWGEGSDPSEIFGKVNVTNSFESQADLDDVRDRVENTNIGDRYPTIQDAIDMADPGDVIEVAAGTFTERIVIDKPLTLRGATYTTNKNGYEIPADYTWDDTEETIINNPDPITESNLVDIKDTSNVVFEGFIVQSLNAIQSSKNDHLLRVYADTVSIDNIVIRNNVIGPNTDASQDGTYGRMGLYLALPNYGDYDIKNSLITGNKIIDAKGNGNNVFIWGGADKYSSERGDLSGTIIEDNEISGSHRSGIEIAGSADNLTIRNNRIHSNRGLETDASSDLKYGNGIVIIRMGSDKTRESAEGSKNLTIENNEIFNNEKNGIYLGPINSGHLISHNNIHDNDWDAVRIDLYESYHSRATAVFDKISNITLKDNSLLAESSFFGARVLVDASNDEGFELQATENWWGDSAGPCNDSDNTSNCGSLVSGYINYNNWLTSEPAF